MKSRRNKKWKKMFCYQCQETAGCSGCTQTGVCGKTPETANLQDLLIYVTKGLSEVTTQLRVEKKAISKDVNHLVTENLFVTITNANFDPDFITDRIQTTLNHKSELLGQLNSRDALSEAALWNAEKMEFAAKASSVGVLATENEDIRSLRELILYGLKGMAAYLKHANALGKENEAIDAFLQNALAKTMDSSLGVNELVALTLETGKYGVDAAGIAGRRKYIRLRKTGNHKGKAWRR
jgi:hydroxylamine reductase